jgi:hypothetical protein
MIDKSTGVVRNAEGQHETILTYLDSLDSIIIPINKVLNIVDDSDCGPTICAIKKKGCIGTVDSTSISV